MGSKANIKRLKPAFKELKLDGHDSTVWVRKITLSETLLMRDAEKVPEGANEVDDAYWPRLLCFFLCDEAGNLEFDKENSEDLATLNANLPLQVMVKIFREWQAFQLGFESLDDLKEHAKKNSNQTLNSDSHSD